MYLVSDNFAYFNISSLLAFDKHFTTIFIVYLALLIKYST